MRPPLIFTYESEPAHTRQKYMAVVGSEVGAQPKLGSPLSISADVSLLMRSSQHSVSTLIVRFSILPLDNNLTTL